MNVLDEFYNYKIKFCIENFDVMREGMNRLEIWLGGGLTVSDFKGRPA
jgi:hypothetical protein